LNFINFESIAHIIEEEYSDNEVMESHLPKLEEQKSSMESDSDSHEDWFDLEISEHFETPRTPRFDEEVKGDEITITDMLAAKPEAPQPDSCLSMSNSFL
jgi:hypothetical protein